MGLTVGRGARVRTGGGAIGEAAAASAVPAGSGIAARQVRGDRAPPCTFTDH